MKWTKILILCLVAVLLLPTGAFAAEGEPERGILFGQTLDIYDWNRTIKNGTTTKLTDGDPNSGENVATSNRASVVYVFPYPMSIQAYTLLADQSSSVIAALYFYDSAGNHITNIGSLNRTGQKTNLSRVVDNVKRVALVNQTYATSWQVYEFDLFAVPDTTPPSIPGGLYAAGKDEEVHLIWAPVPDLDVARYNIYVDGVRVASVKAVPDKVNEYIVTGLTNDVTYSFTVSAVDWSGNESGQSKAVTAAPIGPDRTPPAVPVGLSATPGFELVNLNWRANTEADLQGYIIYRDGTKIAGPITRTTYTDQGLSNGVTYTYQISAIDTSGNESERSNSVTATPDFPTPSPPKDLIGKPDDQIVTLTWAANASSEEVTGYNVYRGSEKIAGPMSETSYTVTGLTNKQLYRFSVTAVNRYGRESPPSVVQAIPDNPPPPAAPIGLAATPGGGEVSLTWKANSEKDLQGYHVFVDGVRVTSSPIRGTSYKATGLTNGQTYSFYVIAVNVRRQESAPSNSVSATPINAPKNLTARAGNEKVSLQWDKMDGASLYRIYRDGVMIAESVAPSYEDTGLVNDTLYTYRVSALINGAETEKSAPASARPGKIIDFPGPGGPGGGDGHGGLGTSILDIIKTAFNWLNQFGFWIIAVLALLFAPTIVSFFVWLFRKLFPQATEDPKQRKALTAEEKERRAKERKLNKARDEKYEFLTRTGRIAERDTWAAQTNYLRPEQRQQKAREQRANRKAREASSGGRKPRATRKGRKPRGK